MYWVIAYDIANPRRLRRVARLLRRWGHRVQHSVFELRIDHALLPGLRAQLEESVDPALDSVRMYPVQARQSTPAAYIIV